MVDFLHLPLCHWGNGQDENELKTQETPKYYSTICLKELGVAPALILSKYISPSLCPLPTR